MANSVSGHKPIKSKACTSCPTESCQTVLQGQCPEVFHKHSISEAGGQMWFSLGRYSTKGFIHSYTVTGCLPWAYNPYPNTGSHRHATIQKVLDCKWQYIAAFVTWGHQEHALRQTCHCKERFLYSKEWTLHWTGWARTTCSLSQSVKALLPRYIETCSCRDLKKTIFEIADRIFTSLMERQKPKPTRFN